MATENFTLARARASSSDPARDGVAFTGATADQTISPPSRGVYIASDGDLKVDMLGYDGATGATLTFVGVKGGTILPIVIIKIYDTGTTVSGVALY